MSTEFDLERLLRFLTEWRGKVLRTPVDRLSDENMGKLIAINTTLALIAEIRKDMA